MSRGKTSLLSLWHLDPFAEKESRQSPLRIEKLLYQAAEFFTLKPASLLHLAKKMSVIEAIRNFSSQLGMAAKIIPAEKILQSDNLPIIALHNFTHEITLLLPHTGRIFIMMSEGAHDKKLIHSDEIPKFFNEFVLLFLRSEGAYSSPIELNDFIKRFVPKLLIAAISLGKLLFSVGFILLLSQLFLSKGASLWLGIAGSVALIMSMDYLLSHVVNKNFVMASLSANSFFYQKLFSVPSEYFAQQMTQSMIIIKKLIFDDVNYYFLKQAHNFIYGAIIATNLLFFWWCYPPLSFGVLGLLFLSFILRRSFENKLDSLTIAINESRERQIYLVDGLESTFAMMLSLKAIKPLIQQIAIEWRTLKVLKLGMKKQIFLSNNVKILMPLLSLLLALILLFLWPLKLSFSLMLFLLFDMALLGYSLAQVVGGAGFVREALSLSSRNYLATIPSVISGKRVMPLKLSGTIELLNVSYAYAESGQAIIKNASLTIEAHRCYQIMGKSGAGKSTLMKLMMGIIFPSDGQIFFDGQDLRSLDLNALHSHFGVLRQDAKLFAGSIYDNIVCGRTISLKAIEKLLLSHEVFDMLLDLPMGLQTYVFLKASNLSRAQIVIMLMARALISDPKIVFMDEIFKGIDAHEQKIICDFLSTLNMTRIIISHQKLAIASCEIIYIKDSLLKLS